MSKIFTADYSECRDTNREISSNLTYISEIFERLDKLNKFINDTDVSSSVWDKSFYEADYITLCSYLNEETTRYNNFYNNFYEFYSSLEGEDEDLANSLTSFLAYSEQNGSYDYYMGVISIDESEESIDSIYNLLMDKGFSEEEAMITSALYDAETRKLFEELSGLSEEELNAKIKEIINNDEKSLSEFILIDFLAINNPSTWGTVINDISGNLNKDSNILLIAQKYFFQNNKVLNENDIKSIQGEINILSRTLSNGQQSKLKSAEISGKLENLIQLRNKSASGIKKMSTIKNYSSYAAKIGDGIAYGWFAISEIDKIIESDNDYGMEIDDIIVETANDVGSFAAGVKGWEIGASVGTWIGEGIGSFFAPGPGTVIGGSAGSLVGGAIGAGVAVVNFDEYVRKPINDFYENTLEKKLESIDDKINEVNDWWDTLWW